MRTHRVGSHTPEESRRSSDLGHRVEGLILAAVALLALVAGLTRAPWAATVWPWLAMIAGLLLLIALYLTHPPSDWPKIWRDPRQRRHTIIAAAGWRCLTRRWSTRSFGPAFPRAKRLRLSYLHEFGHLQTLPLALAHAGDTLCVPWMEPGR